MPTTSDTGTPASGLRAHYKRMLAGAPTGSGAAEGLESATSEPDLSNAAIDERISRVRAELRAVVKQYLGDKGELYDLADKIASNGETTLKAVRDGEDERLADPDISASLEVIVRTDGSRPSFMVRNGKPDPATSPVGAWAGTLDTSADLLRQAIRCVGRIDDPSKTQGFVGTGILIGNDLALTNRHVLQAIVSDPRAADGTWKLNEDVAIDFGHEFRAQESIGRRAVKRVVFAGSQWIDPEHIDHAKLDVALLELAPAGPSEIPQHLVSVDLAPDWGQRETGLFIIGYPGRPPQFAWEPSLLELLFLTTFGCKRLAPGLVMKTATEMSAGPKKWTLAHDATTLGGNSGSSVLVIGREHITAGLHYGGRFTPPRENWCHVLGLTLDETNGRDPTTLRQHLKDYGVDFIDRLPT